MSSQALFHVTVKAVIIHDGKILLLKKIQPSADGFGNWELPGGGMEYHEGPDEALIREIREETGLELASYHISATFHVIRPQLEIVGLSYRCTPVNTAVKLSNEHETYCWVEPEHLNQYVGPKIYHDILKSV